MSEMREGLRVVGPILTDVDGGERNSMVLKGKVAPGVSQAVAHVTSGTYHRDLIEAGAGVQWVTGTEVEVTQVAEHIVADDGRDALFSWIRMQFWLYDTAQRTMGEWAVIRCDKDEALQDLNDDVVVENLHKQGRILRRDMFMSCDPDGGSIKRHKVELFNVKLDDDEELRLVIRPWVSAAGATCYATGILEWREVGA